MKTEKIAREDWARYFDQVTKFLEGKRAVVELESLKLGDQVEANSLPLFGITYDYKNDIIEVAMDGLDHLIHKPQDVFVGVGEFGIESIEIVDAQGEKQIISLFAPVVLPKPERAQAA